MKTAETEKTRHPVDMGRINNNDLMAFVYYATVSNSGGDTLEVKNVDDGMDFNVRGQQLIERSFSADQFHEEVKTTKTVAAEILVSSFNRPLTVCFEKQSGEKRVLRGRLITPEPLLGRSMVEDLDLSHRDKHRLRLVDHRTIEYLIVDGVKYVVK